MTTSVIPLLLRVASGALFSFFLSCDQVREVAGPSESESLVDSTLSPRVVFTYPSHGSVGPYEVFTRNGGRWLPHFVLRFNKLMSVASLEREGVVRVSGFDGPVRVIATASDQFSDHVEFFLYAAPSAQYYYSAAYYELGRSYVVTVDTGATDINRLRVSSPFSFSFKPEPALRIVRTLPDPGAGVIPAYRYDLIELMFNSQMTSSAIPFISISPSVPGTWSLKSDSTTISYAPSAPLAYSTTYRVIVQQGLPDRYGNALPSGQVWDLSTKPFSVENAYPLNGATDVDIDHYISLGLTGPAQMETLTGSVSISPPTEVATTLSSGRFIGITPVTEFLQNTAYTIVLSDPLKATDGTPLTSPYTHRFSTGSYRVVYTYPSDGATGVYRWSGFYVSVNGRLDPATVQGAVTIVPSVQGQFNAYSDSRSFQFSATSSMAPRTRYTVTVSPSLKSKYGTPLSASYSFSFVTGD